MSVTITTLANNVKQPRGGYLPVKLFKETHYESENELFPDENGSKSLIGTTVDNMTRILLGAKPKKVFEPASFGMMAIKDLNFDLIDVKGYLSLHDLNDYLDLDLDSEDFDSVGGLVIDALGRLPQTNDETTLPNGIRIKVLKVEKNRIESVRLILPDTLTQKDV